MGLSGKVTANIQVNRKYTLTAGKRGRVDKGLGLGMALKQRVYLKASSKGRMGECGLLGKADQFVNIQLVILS